MTSTPDILKKIVDRKREEVVAAKNQFPLGRLLDRLSLVEDKPRGFEQALAVMAESGGTAIVAEIKKASPSKGTIRPDFDPVEIAEIYQNHGATCLSILTESTFFQGHLHYLGLVREQVSLPLLRKDFIFDPYQIYEARAFGADAILLIAAMLDLPQLQSLTGLAVELQMDVLLEVHDEAELEKALQTDCRLIGINNRSLHTFVTDLATTERLRPLVPSDRLVVSESGINSRADVERLLRAGAGAFLVGESLMRERNMGRKLEELLG
ncbi:indole-3-glycerol phosphate synthase TrpC [Desulfuromonas sp. AOP6]|uniref:indole-3-glycerol phosphate synthase TrpC n=1 Tax=Desulfuromonas sp. AOP6 TaxID=1566351 RepID=UPI00127A0130|nr:indole-3-glycerol phosphate synthase TrpC [Desulfuromonas sp. AOP6]BCA80433.1 indole-3-glycerol-phosphate synthase [Desulfuromonas sp. AOP6]